MQPAARLSLCGARGTSPLHHGNNQRDTSYMFIPRLRHWHVHVLHCVFVYSLISTLSAQDFTHGTAWGSGGPGNGNFRAYREVEAVAQTGGGTFTYLSWDGFYYSRTLAEGQSTLLTVMNKLTGPQFIYSGLTSSSGDKTGNAPAFSKNFNIKFDGDPTEHAHTLDLPATSCLFSYDAGNASAKQFLYTPPQQIFLNFTDKTTSDTNVTDVFEGLWLMFDNRSGGDLSIPFGTEELDLAPGYNIIPFYGQVDENGIPMALPLDFQGKLKTGPDGKKYLAARLVPGVESLYDWSAFPDYDVFDALNGTVGPVIKTTEADGTNNYITLPAGVTRGNNLPLPPGVTTSNGVSLPPGVTPGTNGGLPSGVVSGGTSYLPPGITAGTTAGNTGNTSDPTESPTGNMGGNVGGGTTTGGTVGGTIDVGPLFGTPDGEAAGALARFKDSITAGSDEMSGFNWKFWTDPEVSNDQDSSWMTNTLELGNGLTANIEINPEWVSILRAWLLFALKVGFCWAVIQLLMK